MPMSAGACRIFYLLAALHCVAAGLPSRSLAPSGVSILRKDNQLTFFKTSGQERVKLVSYAIEDDRMPIMVWVANGTALFKAVLDYKGEGMKECDLLTSKVDIAQFERRFDREIRGAVPNFFRAELPGNFQSIDQIASECTAVQARVMSKLVAVKKARSESGRRQKRSLKDWIWPGTKWCGYGNIASNDSDYGVHHEIDKCCQEHDYCPMAITAFETKYHYSNWQLHTITHCDCDDKFFQCLNDVSRTCDSAKYLGDFYFNFIQLDCFTLEYGEVCTESTWWGQCRKRSVDYFAKVRKTPKFLV